MSRGDDDLTPPPVDERTARTLAHYDAAAEGFWQSTRTHDVTQNYAALLDAIRKPPPFTLLDFGCGPGRDLAWFHAQGHTVIGLDGSARFVEMARAHAGVEVWKQDFLALSLPSSRFDGVFANASLFHVPRRELPRVLRALFETLVPGGVLLASNPRGDDSEGFSGERYGSFHTLETWRTFVTGAGFVELDHYYRPSGKPRAEQPWLVTVWRRPDA